MELEELRNKKRMLEEEIRDRLRVFEKETGTEILDVNIDRYDRADYLPPVIATVKLNVLII